MAIRQDIDLLTSIFHDLDATFEQIVKWRRYLHQNPELSFQEKNTAKFIEDSLRKMGLDVITKVGGNGILGILKGEKPGKTIALRADFDALPIIDEKEVDYKSSNHGIMHACGHDGHTSSLLGVAQTLAKYRHFLKGTLLFVFQHAEELPPGGAKSLIEHHYFNQVDFIFGAHLATDLPLGKIAVGHGYKMAAVDKFKLTIEGKGGHGARPQHTIDSIVIGSDIVSSLQKIVSRRIDPLQSAVVTIGIFHAGTAFNVIADRAILEGTVRTFDNEVRKQVENEIHSIVSGIANGFQASYKIDYLHGYPALFNHNEATEIVRALLTDIFSENDIIELLPSMEAEDFSYYLQKVQGTYFKVGARNEKKETQYPHHHPKFDFDERALLTIEKSFVKIVSHFLF